MKTLILIIGAIFLIALLLAFVGIWRFFRKIDAVGDADDLTFYDVEDKYLISCARRVQAKYPDEPSPLAIREIEPRGA